MQNIIIYFISSVIFGSVLSIFLDLVKRRHCDDFTFKDFLNNIKLKNIDLKYIIIYFIILYLLTYNSGITEKIIFVPLVFSLLLAFIVDSIFMIIPDTSYILIIFCGIIKNIIFFSKENIISSLLGLLMGGITFWLINFICEKFTKKTGFGLGDIKLLGALGFFFGLKSIIVIMILSVVISSLFGIIFLIIRAIKKFKEEYIPFGPFIVTSTFIVYILSADRIINIYFQLIDKIIT